MTKTGRFYLIAFAFLWLAKGMDAQYYYGPPPPNKPSQPNTDNAKKSDKSFNPSGYITASFGLTAPLGAFATNYGGGYGNYALGGNAECISVGIPLANTNVGVALMYGFYTNPFDMNSYINTLNFTQNGQYYGVYNDEYGSQAIMGGLFYTWPVRRLSFDFRAMAGIMVCQLPEIAYASPATDPNPIQDFTWDYASSTSTAFGYDFGVGIRYKLQRSVCVALNFDYIGTTPSYSTSETYTDDNGNVVSQNPVSGSLPMSLFNVSFAVGYQFK